MASKAKQVFVVLDGVRHEGESNIGVFASRKEAFALQSKWLKTPRSRDCYCAVQAWEIGGKEPVETDVVWWANPVALNS